MHGTRPGAGSGFFDHLETLRRGVLATLAIFVLAASVSFFLMDRIMPYALAPIRGLGLGLYALAPFEKFTAYLKASAVLGAAVAAPVAAALAAGFVAPALGTRARRSIGFVLAALLAFAFAGAALAWFAVLPFTLRFFARFAAGDGIEPMWSLGSYVSLAASVLVASGIVFLVPPCLLALMRAGVLSPATLAKGRRYAIVAIALAAGAITPTVDVVTQLVAAAVMWGLFEITVLIGRLVSPERDRRASKEEERHG